MTPRNLFITRIVMAAWALGWFLKSAFYVPYLTKTIFDYPVIVTHFPVWLLNPWTALVGYFLPLLVLPFLLSGQGRSLFVPVLLMLFCSAVMLWHVDTCNDATFVTSFWIAVWLLWFVWHGNDESDVFRLHARVLIQCLVGMIFLAGTVGKLTPEYLDGSVISGIFGEQTRQSPAGWIMAAFPAELRTPVTVFVGRSIVIVEGLLALAPFWPYWFVVVLATGTGLVISVFSTWRIFSVLSCLLGLLWAGLALEKEIRRDGATVL